MYLFKMNLKKLETFDSSPFISPMWFNNDGAQLYLILQPFYYGLKRLGNSENLYHGNLTVYQPENLLFLPLLIIVFLDQLNGSKIQIFVWYLKKPA